MYTMQKRIKPPIIDYERNYDAAVGWCKQVLSCTESFSALFPSQALDCTLWENSRDKDEHLILSEIKLGTISNTNTFEDTLEKRCNEFGFSKDSLESLLHNMTVRHIKRQTVFVRSKVISCINTIFSTKNESIVSMACKLQYPPYLLVRMIFESLIVTETGGEKKATIKAIMRDPSLLILDSDNIKIVMPEKLKAIFVDKKFKIKLLCLTYHAISLDKMFGPDKEIIRRELGLNYEKKLENSMTKLGDKFYPSNLIYLNLSSIFYVQAFHMKARKSFVNVEQQRLPMYF